MINRILLAFLTIFIAAVITSCGPTYPAEKIVDSVKQLCKKEYKVDVAVKIVGKTIGVHIPLEGLFDKETLQISTKAWEKVGGVELSVARVALSTDKSIEFYTIIAADRDAPGAEIVMTSYVKDLRRLFFEDISRGEFRKRLVLDVRINPQSIIDSWLGEFTLEETKLDDFICKQASRRIMEEFKENNMLAGKFKISSCSGELKDRVFKFSADITREGLPMSELIHGTAWHEKVLELCLKHICYTVNIYEFKDFDKIELYNKFDNKDISATRKDINKWRNRRIKIE